MFEGKMSVSTYNYEVSGAKDDTPFVSSIDMDPNANINADLMKITLIGIGELSDEVVKMVLRDWIDAKCENVLMCKNCLSNADLDTTSMTVKKGYMLIMTSYFDDDYCDNIFSYIGSKAKEAGVLTIGVVPAMGRIKGSVSSMLFSARSKAVDSLFIVSEESMDNLPYLGKQQKQELDCKHQSICHAINTIIRMFTRPSFICIDPADVAGMLKSGKIGLMGAGVTYCEERGYAATKAALNHFINQGPPPYEAASCLLSLNCPHNLTMEDIGAIIDTVCQAIKGDSNMLTAIHPENFAHNSNILQVTILLIFNNIF